MNKLDFARELQGRTKMFAVQLLKFYGRLPRCEEGRVLGRQLLRSGTSVADLIEDASRGVNLKPNDVANSIDEMKRAGVDVISSSQVG